MVVKTSTQVMVTIWNLMMWTCTVVISKTMSLTSVIYKDICDQYNVQNMDYESYHESYKNVLSKE
jgi:hypothetical protein